MIHNCCRVNLNLVLQFVLGLACKMKLHSAGLLRKSLSDEWHRFAASTSIHGLKFVMDKQGNAFSRYCGIDAHPGFFVA